MELPKFAAAAQLVREPVRSDQTDLLPMLEDEELSVFASKCVISIFGMAFRGFLLVLRFASPPPQLSTLY